MDIGNSKNYLGINKFEVMNLTILCRYPRGTGIGLDLAAHGIGKNMKGKPIEIGKAVLRRSGTDAAIIGYGTMVNEALAAAEMLQKVGINVTVCDARFCKPLDIVMVRSVIYGFVSLLVCRDNHAGLEIEQCLSYSSSGLQERCP